MKFRTLFDVFYLTPALCCWHEDDGTFVLNIALWAWCVVFEFPKARHG